MDLKRTIVTCVVLGLCGAALAAPAKVDPKVEAFTGLHRKIQTDPGGATEKDAARLLGLGKGLGRPYAASLALKGYFSHHANPSAALLLAAAENALVVGDYRAAAARYKSYLRANGGAKASDTAAVLYSVLIDLLGDTDDAYRFMTQHGTKLRATAASRRFDGWYVREARRRKDHANCARALAMVFAGKMPLEQERLYFWEDLDWLLAELSRASADQYKALPHCRKLAGLIRNSKRRSARANLVVAQLAFKAGSAGKDADALKKDFAKVTAAAQAYFNAFPTAEALKEIVQILSGGIGTISGSRWAKQGPSKQAFFVAAFGKLNDADRRAIVSVSDPSRGKVARLLAGRKQWTDLLTRYPAAFAGNDDTRLLPFEPRAEKPAVLAAQAKALRGVRSYDAAVVNSLAGGGASIRRCVDHLVAREMWHLPAASVRRAYENGIWPVWRDRLAKGEKQAVASQRARGLIRLGATALEKTALPMFDPDAAAAYLRTVWTASKDKSAIVPRLRAFDWVPWSPQQRRRVFSSVGSAFKVWANNLARQARKKDSKVDPKLLKQIPVINRAIDASVARRGPDLTKAPNALCKAVAAAAVAAGSGRDSKAYGDAALVAYKLVADYDVRKTPCGREIMAFLIRDDTRKGGRRNLDFLCAVLADQLARYSRRTANTRIHEVIGLVMTDRYGRTISNRKPNPYARINPIFAKATLAQLARGHLPPKIFAWFRATRSGPYWTRYEWGTDVMAKIVQRQAFHKTAYRPLGVPSATATYMLLIRREFPKLAAKYPVGTCFDDMFVAEAAKTGQLDWHYWEYGRDEKRKVATAAAKMLAACKTLPFGYNGEKAVYSRTHFWDWQARAYNAAPEARDAMTRQLAAAFGKTRFDAYAMGRQYFSTQAVITRPAGRKEFFDRLGRYLDSAGRQPDRLPLPYLGQLAKITDPKKLTKSELDVLVGIFPHRAPPVYAKSWHYETLGQLLGQALLAQKRAGDLFALAPYLWKIGRDTSDTLYQRRMAALCKALLAAGHSDLAHVAATQGLERLGGVLANDARATLQSVRSQALADVGGVIPVRRFDPRYPVYAAQASFLTGKSQQARDLYMAHRDRAAKMYKELDPRFCTWMIDRDTEMAQYDAAEALARVLSRWFDSVGQDFEPELRGRLALSFANIFFARQEYPIAAARYKSIAAAAEYAGSSVRGEAELRLAEVYRLTKRYDLALTELEKLAARPDKPVQAQAYYQQALVKFDQEEYPEARQALEKVFVVAPGHSNARILEGKVFLKLKRVELATEIEAGTPTRKNFLVPGTPLAVTLIDQNLSILGAATHVEIRAWSDSGDEEHFTLNPFGESKTKFRGKLRTALAPAAKGDGVLQVLGGEKVHFDFSEAVKKAKKIRVASRNTLTVVTDAEVLASSGRILSKAERERQALEEMIRRQLEAEGRPTESKVALATVRQANQIKPGNPINVRVVDADRSRTAKPDSVAVTVSTSSGDSIRAFTLNETATHSGLFEGAVPTASGHATAYASDTEDGRDANFAISSKDYGPWAAQADNVRPKFFSVDLNDNVAVGTMTVQAGVALRKLKQFRVQTSLNGRLFTTVAAWPRKFEPWDGSPRLELARFAGGRAPRRLGDVVKYLETGHITAKQKKVAVKVAGPSLKLGPTAGGHAKAMALGASDSYVARLSAAFHQPNRRTRTFRLVPERGSGRQKSKATFFLVVDGKPARAASRQQDTQSVTASLGKGVHVVEIYFLSSYYDRPAWVLQWDIDRAPYMAPCPTDAFDIARHPEIRKGVYKPPGTVTADKDGASFGVAFPADLNARVIRLMLVDFETDAPAIDRIALVDRSGKKRLPVREDFMTLRRNGTLEIVPGDEIIVRYEDPTVLTEGKEVQTASLTATYSNAEISACFVEYETDAQGERTARYIPMRRFGPKDKIQVFINDPDMDVSDKLDTVTFTARTTDGKPVALKALETARHAGVFLGAVFPVTKASKRKSELVVKPGDDVILAYLDQDNTDPGIPWQRRCVVEQVWFKTPVMVVYNVRSEEVEQDPEAKAPRARPRPQKLAADVADVVPATRRLLAAAPEATDTAAKATVLIGGPCLVEVLFPTIAKSPESTADIFVQTKAGRAAHKPGVDTGPFDINVPGTIKLSVRPGEFARLDPPPGYSEVIVRSKHVQLGTAAGREQFGALDDGRFSFAVPMELGKAPAETLVGIGEEELRDRGEELRLSIKGDDELYVGFRFRDPDGKVRWLTQTVALGADGMFHVTDRRYQNQIEGLYIGQKAYFRVIDAKRDVKDTADSVEIELAASSGEKRTLKLMETFPHSGVFKGLVGFAHVGTGAAGGESMPVKYGDTVTATYQAATRKQVVQRTLEVYKGSDGLVQPFSKRFKDPTMAMRTQFMVAEAYLELAKRHRQLGEAGAARREIAQGKKLLEEAIRDYPASEARAQSEYLLADLALEFANDAKNETIKKNFQAEAIARYSNIVASYPESGYAPKAQYRKALALEKMGRFDDACGEYVKLSYRYPENELVAETIARLGQYFLTKGKGFRAEAKKEKDVVKAEATLVKARKMFKTAGEVLGRLGERFPDHQLAGKTRVLSAQSFVYAEEFELACETFEKVIKDSRQPPALVAEAMYWCADSYLKMVEAADPGGRRRRWRRRPGQPKDFDPARKSYQLFKRLDWDYPTTKWARYARGRLASELRFERIEQ